jgi:hypothetical protein
MFIPIQTPPASPRARELGHDIAEVVRDFRTKDPGLGRQEVSQAFRVAQQNLQPEFGGAAAPSAAVLGVIAGLVAMLAVGVSVFLARQSGSDSGTWIIVMVGALTVVVGLAAAVIASRR